MRQCRIIELDAQVGLLRALLGLVPGGADLVDTTLGAEGIWKNLQPHIDTNDNVLIIGVTRDYSGWLPQKAWEWDQGAPRSCGIIMRR